jgi:chemotaxis protein MotB
MASAARRGKNEPEPRPIIVKKVIEAGHDSHHGGAWKIAYADFVTAMMAFFLLLWLLGATDEDQKKGLADYFTPTLIEYKQNSAGANGIMNGESIIASDNYPHQATQTGMRAIVVPRDVTGGEQQGDAPTAEDREQFEQLRQQLMERIQASPELRRLGQYVRFSEDDEGLRIDLMDEADFTMFRVGTDQLLPEARRLVQEVAQVIAGVPNNIIVRGHTDALPYAAGRTMNNWRLSTGRAETTRATLNGAGVPAGRFSRIEGVAERDPYVPGDRYDPRNRRISVTLAWRRGEAAPRVPRQIAGRSVTPPATPRLASRN